MIQKRQKRNVRLAHLRTTIVLEPYIWECISDILQRESIDLDSFCQEIDKRRQFSSLASSMRIVTLFYFRLLVASYENGLKKHKSGTPILSAPAAAKNPTGRQRSDNLKSAFNRFARNEKRG
ncbi:MAG: ribbon-helix-helix domain-containing protein [Candidatus Puniceispirillum sp.]